MNYLVHPQTLVFNAKQIEGFNNLVKIKEIPQWELLSISHSTVSNWTDDWPDGMGFGSSDMTFMIKDFIDSVINTFGYNEFKTEFKPNLSIVNC